MRGTLLRFFVPLAAGVFVCLVPGVSVAQQATPAPVTAPPVLSAQEDTSVTWTDDDRMLFGVDKREVDARGLFTALGRTDLLAQGDANAHRRVVFGIAAGAVALVGITTAVVLFATSPDVGSGRCNSDVAYFNSVCTPSRQAHELGAITSLAVGLLGGGVLAAIAWWNRPDVFTRYELKKFVEEHNKSIGAPSVTFDVAPVVGPGFGALAIRGAF